MTTTRRWLALCLVPLTAIVLVTFYPTIRIGFYGDDWWLIANAGKLTLFQYLRFYFDPFAQTIWYRPVHGMLLLVEYKFFGSNPDGYHLVYILIHLLNCLLLLAVIYRVSRRWQLGLIAALLYAVLFPGSSAVFSTTIHDPLAALFCLATVLFWFNYLAHGSRSWFSLAAVSFVLALLSKETSAGLIVTMFLIDLLFAGHKFDWRGSIRQYGLFALILLAYLAIELQVQERGHFTNRAGYALGPQVAENLGHYLGLLVWPWGWDQPILIGGFVIALLALVGLALRGPRRALTIGRSAFLFIQVFLILAAVLAFPTDLFEQRYLYAASAVPAILLAALAVWIVTRFPARRSGIALVSASTAILILLHSSSTAASAAAMAELNREARVPFRDIVQQHPSFPPDTYLYLVDPPGLLRHFAPSMFFFRYGSNVSVWSVDPQWWGTIDPDRYAGLREHKNTWVYYYDEANKRHEVAVDPVAPTTTQPALPVDYRNGMRLEGYELTGTTVKRGEEVVLLLYWNATELIDKEYTVFVHLVNKQGEVVAGQDSQPQNGAAPTSGWKVGRLVVDPHVVTIPEGASVGGGYRLEVGVYYEPTMERVGLAEGVGAETGDAVVIRALKVQD